MDRNNFLDCIRAVAALLVLFLHGGAFLPNGVLLGGAIGVSLFFCLSGFLIATLLINLEDPLPENLGKFVFRRFMRIWPLMAFQLVLTGSLIATFSPDRLEQFLQLLPGLLTFTNVSYITNLGLSVGVLWSLQVEFWFYISMAIIVLVAGRAALPWVATVGFCAAWLAKFGVFSIPLSSWQTTMVNLDELMAGVLCACAIHHRGRLVRAVFSNRALFLWTPFALILVLSTFRFKSDQAFYLAMSAAAYLTAPVILHQFARPLRGDFEPLAALGRISYSVYLMQAVIFEFVSSHIFPPALQFISTAGAAIIVSAATYRWIEMPFVLWSKQKTALRSHSASAVVQVAADRGAGAPGS